MRDGVCPPLRMRYSFESRCRIVQLILAGAARRRPRPPAARARQPATGCGRVT
jgi:hypothetical protein